MIFEKKLFSRQCLNWQFLKNIMRLVREICRKFVTNFQIKDEFTDQYDQMRDELQKEIEFKAKVWQFYNFIASGFFVC